MNLTVEHRNTEAVVGVTGTMDVDSAYDVYLTVMQQGEEGYSTVTLDLAGVDFIDSTGLGMLVRCRDELRHSLESRLRLRNPSGRVAQMLDLTALTAEFDVQSESDQRG